MPSGWLDCTLTWWCYGRHDWLFVLFIYIILLLLILILMLMGGQLIDNRWRWRKYQWSMVQHHFKKICCSRFCKDSRRYLFSTLMVSMQNWCEIDNDATNTTHFLEVNVVQYCTLYVLPVYYRRINVPRSIDTYLNYTHKYNFSWHITVHQHRAKKVNKYCLLDWISYWINHSFLKLIYQTFS